MVWQIGEIHQFMTLHTNGKSEELALLMSCFGKRGLMITAMFFSGVHKVHAIGFIFVLHLKNIWILTHVVEPDKIL